MFQSMDDQGDSLPRMSEYVLMILYPLPTMARTVPATGDGLCPICGKPFDDRSWLPLGKHKPPVCPPKGEGANDKA